MSDVWCGNHRQLLGRLLWMDRPDIKNAVCQLSTHVGTATTRDEINIERLLRHSVGNPACNMIVGCNLDVPGITGTPQGSVVVMTDADWAGDVKDRRSYSGIAVWVKGPVENTWYPVYASSKKQNLVRVDGSGWWSLRGTRNERPMEQDLQLFTWDDCSVHEQFSSSGIRETQGCESTHSPRGHEGLFFLQAWAMEPGQRILKVHGDSQQVADCVTKIMTPQAAHRRVLGL